MVNVPLMVVGLPWNMYCTLRPVVIVREAFRSILKFFTGSTVMRNCRSSVLLVVAGVATFSFTSSQLFSRAFSMKSSPVRPKAKSSPGESRPLLRDCPKALPTLGMNPGSAIEY